MSRPLLGDEVVWSFDSKVIIGDMWRKSVAVSETPALSLSVVEWSRLGLPCVLVHGLGDAACVWSSLAIRIMPQFRVAAMDLRGHGDSDWDPQADYSIHSFTADLTKIVSALGFERMVLIGHSVGAGVAIRFAAENPARILGLVIVDFGPEVEQRGVDDVLRSFVEMPRSFTSVEAYAEWLTESRALANPKQLQQFARGSLRQSPSEGWEVKADARLAEGSDFSRLQATDGRYRFPELWSALEQIRAPSLVVRGVGSGVFPRDVAIRMAERALCAGGLETIGGAGHAVAMDNPEEFSTRVAKFLATILPTI
jgi:pimeloyl-ACP methyl ester carboxylesterase